MSHSLLLSGEMQFLLPVLCLSAFQSPCACALFYYGSVHHLVQWVSFLVAATWCYCIANKRLVIAS